MRAQNSLGWSTPAETASKWAKTAVIRREKMGDGVFVGARSWPQYASEAATSRQVPALALALSRALAPLAGDAEGTPRGAKGGSSDVFVASRTFELESKLLEVTMLFALTSAGRSMSRM